MEALNYEKFVLRAFGYPNKELERHGDPAGLADADYFADSYLDKVKIATGYSMEILNRDIRKKFGEILTEKDDEDLEDYITSLMKANNVKQVNELIVSYANKIIDKYYHIKEGILIAKK